VLRKKHLIEIKFMCRKMTEREKWIIKKANAQASEARARKIIMDSRKESKNKDKENKK
tara:strand:- start:20662 stop:20835 length:174 start_codon:yes stop_codon:yes gene_type:complete